MNERELEKIKELRIKAETAKALFSLADDESERKHFKKLLEKYKTELLKFLDEPKTSNQPQEQKRLSDILESTAENISDFENKI